ncbi:hypothetical protein [Bacillus spizizenii]|uniref:hypothetical protein n=1 Tax=Bacillus spizizenii TaxID=96241 RepID=UPI000B440DE8|nr:hypothetical protein [Bacillus spizizenii]OUL02192.1 hypothetical protein B0W20_20820 [Bacillus spizizenii]
MKIKLKKNALNLYIEEHTDFNGNFFGEDYWEDILSRISGRELHVSTSELFKHEFTVLAEKGVLEENIRIPQEYVDTVIDDTRHKKARCYYCNKVSESILKCPHCNRKDYLEPFFDEDNYL